MMRTIYDSEITSTPESSRFGFTKLALSFVMVLTTLFSFVSLSNIKVEEAEAFSPIECLSDLERCIVCNLPTPIPDAYQLLKSTDLQFTLRSVSSANTGLDRVESGINGILDSGGVGFKKINEEIIGYNIEPLTAEEIESGEYTEFPTEGGGEEAYNKGTKVSVYDRFGVSGLRFTSYLGEWNHLTIEACGTSEPQENQASLFYPTRLTPQSTWEDIATSLDPRTQAFSHDSFGKQNAASLDVLANLIFSFTKFIVVMTNGLIEFSFGSVIDTLKLNELIGGEDGVFSILYNGVFTPLIYMMFVITAGIIFYNGIVKRQFRHALGILFRSIIMFILAVMVSVNPSFWIALPNNFAVIAQSLVLSALGTEASSGNGLCATDVGSINSDLSGTSSNVVTNALETLEAAKTNMVSVVGCQFWQNFLLTPWSEAQFGTNWNNLWVEGKIPDWAPEGATSLGNTNTEMVGEAEVPLGNGEVINNWAIYQLSTQTNVHANTETLGTRPNISQNISNDWWRIVDAISNYQEVEATTTVAWDISNNTGSTSTGTSDVKYDVPDVDSPPLEEWTTWQGGDVVSRISIALGSVLFAAVGLLGPLVFAGASSVFAIGVAILMSIAPVMLLFSVWSGKGWEIFKGWGELVLNTTMKRIAVGVLLALSIALTVAVLKMMDSLGWTLSLILLVFLSIILIKSRHTIYNALAFFNFSGDKSMQGIYSNVSGKFGKLTKNSIGLGKTAGGSVKDGLVGAIVAKRRGATFREGFSVAASKSLKDRAYRHNSLRPLATTYDNDNFSQVVSLGDNAENICARCKQRILPNAQGNYIIGRLADGRPLCESCHMGQYEGWDSQEAVIKATDVEKKRGDKTKERDRTIRNAYNERMLRKTHFYKNKNVDIAIDAIIQAKDNGMDSADTKVAEANLFALAGYFSERYREDEVTRVPDEIKDYIDTSVLEAAWNEPPNMRGEIVQEIYATGWLAWYKDNIDEATSITEDQLLTRILAFKQHNKKIASVPYSDRYEL